MEVIKEAILIARKEYDCDAMVWIEYVDDYHDFSFSEKRAIVHARKNNGKIMPGEKYVRQFNKCGGHTYTYRAIPAIHKICLKHDIFDNNC